MARTNRTGLARSLALPRAQLRNVYPALRYGPLDVLKQHIDDTSSSTGGLLDAAVDWGLYGAGRRMSSNDFQHAVRTAQKGEGFVWLGLHEPSSEQLEQLGEVFSLHPLALEDAAGARQRPKLERHENDMFLAMRTLAYVDSVDRDAGGDVVETGAVMVFVGEYFVITVRHGKHTGLAGLRRHLEGNPEQLALGPSAVLHAVADKVVDEYLAVVDAVQQDLEEIESTVFAPRGNTDIERIYQLKRDVIEMKRTVQPLAAPLRELSERPRRLVHAEIREYFRDVSDHLARVHEQVAGFDELLTSILQAGLARVSIAENEDMRKISAWVAIAAVPTMIAGIYGMNFDYMPETQHAWGYPVVLSLMAVICAGLFRGFKRNGWL
ncbi:magnesium and cobalt transport protein CorA [Kineosporia mesophila]|uniref:Magnesium and cobalt transport protein CorA n=1 Tax=Kineosporia mesophila TaxID=566012 RepID=A0ABP6YVJ0_9ACTN|nr:magnesium and cobalt transport protein CorA [Kineosporia mesophila]MCD5351696.1 magnesium and cobalt transport protein CorA [Kineosporia mesophila]